MKPIYFILVFLGSSLTLQAQDTAKTKKIREKRIIIIHKSSDSLPDQKDTIEINSSEDNNIDSDLFEDEDKTPKAIISNSEFNFGFANVSRHETVPFQIGNNTQLPELNNGKSFGIGLGQNWAFNLIKGKLRLWTGIHYDIKNYRFNNNNVHLMKDAPGFAYRIDSNGTSEKSKVVVNYLGVPVALGYQSDPNHVDKGFSVRAGVTGGYRVRTHTKINTSSSSKEKQFDDFNFNDFAITPFIYIGYNSIAIYGRMTTTSLFKHNQGGDANAFEFGLLFQ